MTACKARKQWLTLGLAAGVLGLLWLGGRTRGEPQGQGKEQPPQARPKKFFYGVAACSGCHKNDPKQEDPWMCRCIEYTIWNEKDKHKDAHKVLKGELA